MLKPSPAYAHLTAATNETAVKPVFEAELSNIWGRAAVIQDFFVPRVFSKGGGKFLIQYRFSTTGAGGNNWIFFGELLAPEEIIPRFVQPGKAFFVPELRLAVPVFPYDPKLKELPRFFKPEPCSSILQQLRPFFNLNGMAAVAKVEILGYRLKRRSVLRLTVREKNRDISVVAKLVRPEKAALIFGQLQALEKNGFAAESGENIQVPHPIAVTPEGVLWLEAVSDPSLHDLIGTERFIPGCCSAGLALQKLQTAKLKNLLPYTFKEALAQLKEFAFETAQIYPALRETIQNVWQQLESRCPALKATEFAPVHRDFYDKQLLVGSNRITLVDTDTLIAGDPALDVGNFLAHLILRGKQHALPAESVRQARISFLEAYGSGQSPSASANFQKRAAWWEAATLLRLACLYSLRPRWKKLAFPLLEQSKKTLSGEPRA